MTKDETFVQWVKIILAVIVMLLLSYAFGDIHDMRTMIDKETQQCHYVK